MLHRERVPAAARQLCYGHLRQTRRHSQTVYLQQHSTRCRCHARPAMTLHVHGAEQLCSQSRLRGRIVTRVYGSNMHHQAGRRGASGAGKWDSEWAESQRYRGQ